MQKIDSIIEEIKVAGSEVAGKVKSLIQEGNVSRIVIRDEHGRTVLDIPIVAAAIGAVIVPEIAALGAIVALAAHYTIMVEKTGVPIKV